MEPLILRDVTPNEVRAELEKLAEPIRCFDRFPIWKPITIDPTRPANRNGGTGLIGLHIDFINTENPPDYVAFWCEAEDEGGGGINIVAPFFPLTTTVGLRAERVSHGEVYDLSNVGGDINPFSVIDGPWVRYADGLSYSPAYRALRDRLWNRVQTIELHKGDAFIIDQHTHAHGRLPVHGLGRRLLSMYGRA